MSKADLLRFRKPFPYVSKSKLMQRSYCDYKFYVERVLEEKQEDTEKAIEGSNLHLAFNGFYRKMNEIWSDNKEKATEILFSKKMTDYKIDINKYHYFGAFVYRACMEFIKPTHRDYGKYKWIISSFAKIETKRWIRLNTLLKNKNEIMDCFLPLAVELNIDIPELHLEGTIDRVGVEVLPGGRKVLTIYEYKTGSVPKDVRTKIDDGNYLGWKLPTYASKEIHFYVLLYLLYIGWKPSEDMIDFLEGERWWFWKKDDMSVSESKNFKRDYVTSLQKKYKLFKDAKILSPNDVLVCYYYLDGSYMPIKKFSYASLKGIFIDINDYRSMVFNDGYTKDPKGVFSDLYCGDFGKKCPRFYKCLDECDENYIGNNC